MLLNEEARTVVASLDKLRTDVLETNQEFCNYLRRYLRAVIPPVDADIHALRRTLAVGHVEYCCSWCSAPLKCVVGTIRSLVDIIFLPVQVCCCCYARHPLSVALESILNNTENLVDELADRHRSERARSNEAIVDSLARKLKGFLEPSVSSGPEGVLVSSTNSNSLDSCLV
jgi:hypothetical protein